MYENIYQGNGRLVRIAKIDKIYIEVHGESPDGRYKHNPYVTSESEMYTRRHHNHIVMSQ